MPNSTASRSRALTTSAPAEWPSATGSPRALAQRPLPSVMMATSRAADDASLTVRASLWASSRSGSEPPGEESGSHLEDLGFLGLEVRLELGDLGVGELLQLLVAALLVVGADVAVVLELLEVVHDVAAHAADLHAAVLGQAVGDLHQLAPALLVELGDLQADDAAVVAGREPDVGLHDRLLDGLDRRRVVGLHGDEPRLGDADRRELVQRRGRAVVVDDDAV